MLLDRKMKLAAFDTAVKRILKSKDKHPDRTVRNILELCTAVFHSNPDEEECRAAYAAILNVLDQNEDQILQLIRSFFHMDT